MSKPPRQWYSEVVRRHIFTTIVLTLVGTVVACGAKKHPGVAGDIGQDEVDSGPDVVCGLLGCNAPPPDPPTMPIHVGSPCDADPVAMTNDAGDDDGGDGGDEGGPTDSGPPANPDTNEVKFAKSLGICTRADKDGYGLVSVTVAKGFGVPTAPPDGQWSTLTKFGNLIKPREGAKLSSISTGYAQEYDTPDGKPGRDFVQSANISTSPGGTAPPGFPKAAVHCPQDSTVNNMVDIHLVLKAPSDAAGFQFDFNFYTSEWPEFVCSPFNDAFVAYLTSKGKTDNVSFDSKGDPVSVNNGFFDRCTAGVVTGCSYNGNSMTPSVCAAGTGELQGTGFSGMIQTRCMPAQSATDGGATGWLTTHAPVAPGETFTLDLMIWNAGDTALDSSVLLDNWKWLGGTVTTGTTRVK